MYSFILMKWTKTIDAHLTEHFELDFYSFIFVSPTKKISLVVFIDFIKLIYLLKWVTFTRHLNHFLECTESNLLWWKVLFGRHYIIVLPEHVIHLTESWVETLKLQPLKFWHFHSWSSEPLQLTSLIQTFSGVLGWSGFIV